MRDRALRLVGSAGSPAASYDAWQACRPFLAGCRFILGADAGAWPGHAVNHNLPGGFVVRSLFADQRVLFLDEHTVDAMARTGTAQIGFDYSIALDTQTVSYLEPYLTGRTRVPDGFADVFAFIARPDVNVDPRPYQFEHYARLRHGVQADLDKIFSKLKAYETLRTLDTAHFESTGAPRSVLSDQALVVRTQAVLSRWLYASRSDRFQAQLQLRQDALYALLLKMAQLQIAGPQRPVEAKLWDVLEFCDVGLASMWMREIVIAQHYFAHGQNFRFFGKVQKRKDDLFDVLRGMAWDLFHIRHMEETASFCPDPPARYLVPALLTHDAGLIEVIDLCSLQALAIVPEAGGDRPQPFYSDDRLAGTPLASPEWRTRMHQRFFNDGAVVSRRGRGAVTHARLPGTIRALEVALANAAGIPAPASA